MTANPAARRTAIVGTGHRAQTFTEGLAQPRPVRGRGPVRPQPGAHGAPQQTARRGGPGRGPHLPARRVRQDCSRQEGIEEVVVTTVDALHDGYIVAALRAGCRVVTEKPMTTDAARCRRILDTVARDRQFAVRRLQLPLQPRARTGPPRARGRLHRRGAFRALRVDARRTARRRLLQALAPREGQQRRPDGAQGRPPLRPGQLVARGRARAGCTARAGWASTAGRTANGTAAPRLRPGARLGRRRRRPVRPAPGGERDPARPVPRRRARGRLPPRPQRLRRRHHHRGRHGRAGAVRHRRLDVVPPHRLLAVGGLPGDVQRHRRAGWSWRWWRAGGSRRGPGSPPAGARCTATPRWSNAGGAQILVRPLWQPPRQVEIPEFDHAGHGGGDARMLRTLYDGAAGPAATATDGALALAVGLAANRSFEGGEPVDIADVVRLP